MVTYRFPWVIGGISCVDPSIGPLNDMLEGCGESNTMFF
jgi:hypothetical protein